MNSKRSRIKVTLVASFIALVAFGCAVWMPVSAADPALNVPIAMNFTWQASYAPLRWGEVKGIFKDAGLTFDVLPTQGGDQSLQLLEAGKVDYAFTDGDSLLSGVAAGKVQATAIYVWADKPTFGIASFAPLNGPRAMAGKSFGTTAASTGRWLLPYVLKHDGVDPDSVRIDLVDFSVLYAEFFRGQLDTVQTNDPGSYQNLVVAAQKQGKQLFLTRVSDWGLVGYDKVLVVRNATLRTSPNDVARVVKALDAARSDAFAHATDADIFAAMKDVMPQADEAPLVADYHDYKASIKTSGVVDPKVLASSITRLVGAGIMQKSIPVDGLWANPLKTPTRSR